MSKFRTIVISGVLVAASFVAGTAYSEKQGHMKAAREHLEHAKEQLEKATADKGGHRVKAIALVNDAITEVKAGEEFDDKH